MEYVAQVLALLDLIDPLTKNFIISLALALFLGYIMGAERELRHKDAGISTNMFVVCGSMIFTFLSMTVDPASESRIAAQIVSGIGFLGAGLILKDGANVRNLTTAASMWYAGAVGMMIGFGFHQIAFICGLVGVFIPRVRRFRNQFSELEEIKEVTPLKVQKISVQKTPAKKAPVQKTPARKKK